MHRPELIRPRDPAPGGGAGGSGRVESRLARGIAFARAVRAVCRERGVTRTLRLAVHELLFDLRHRTDTSLDFPSGAARSRVEYAGHEGSNPLLFSEMVEAARLVREESVFLDYGAGKGRALLLAAQHGFRKVIGVERSPALCAIGRANLAVFRRNHLDHAVELHCGDAAALPVPDEVDVVYLFNPFGAETMLRVIARLLDSLDRAPRQLHVLYLHPLLAPLFVEAGFTPVRSGADWLILRHAGP